MSNIQKSKNVLREVIKENRTPFPIRFLTSDLESIRRAAALRGMSINAFVCLASSAAAEKALLLPAPDNEFHNLLQASV